MAERDETVDHGFEAGRVIRYYGWYATHLAVDHDHFVMLREFSNHGVTQSGRRQHDAVHIVEVVETIALVYFGLLRVGDEQTVVLAHALMLDTADELRERGIADIGDNEQNKMMLDLEGRDGRDLLRPVSETVRDIENSFRSGFADVTRSGESPRNS